tara:strand:- start:1093 stop:1311 length:219 start_codon:yes stop_codon:yes gene_type:complete
MWSDGAIRPAIDIEFMADAVDDDSFMHGMYEKPSVRRWAQGIEEQSVIPTGGCTRDRSAGITTQPVSKQPFS